MCRRQALKPIAVSCLALMLASGPVGAAETLRMGGTGTALGMLQQLGAKFTAASGVPIEVVPSLGSSGALRALADSKLDVAVSARPLKADEITAGLRQAAALRTPFVLVTSGVGPTGLKSVDLAGIFNSDKPTWADGTPVRIILRPRTETDTALLGQIGPGMPAAIEAVRQRPEVPVAATDQDNLALAEQIPGSLAASTLAQLRTEKNQLHIVSLDGVMPTLASFERGRYRFAKNLYVILRSNGPADARRFVSFLQSPEGVQALREAGILPGAE